MSKHMLIDAAHLEEIRIAVVDGDKLDKFDFEIPSKAQVKGNIYLAKIIRVEPSLQAAFVDYGLDKHGFLSFSEIHHDYFQIPVGDRHDLEEHIHNAVSALSAESGESLEELDPKEISRIRYQFYRRYKIQEVIKKRQIILVQVTKEERGNKGAALTTYISLAGRYCVLMPNTAKGSGVSRKITDHEDRLKLKKIVSGLEIENGSTVIRTAGVGHTKAEITKDFNCLKSLWDEIRETTVKSTAPCLIHEEAGIIKRAIRDMYSREIESIYVEGEEGYKVAKSFVKKLMPTHIKKIKLYEDKKLPLFSKFNINDQINQIYSTRVDLPSGGYLIINTTEALTSIDVNSGKATRERNISGTALKTNLEAAVEIARQSRLRDLGGLMVIDFIDMSEKRNNSQVEKCLRDAFRDDKAKVQVGTISSFGLLELSRQRLRSSIADANMIVCPHCSGIGFIRSNESIAIQILRKIEEAISVLNGQGIVVTMSQDVALYLMNNKRSFVSEIEERSGLKIVFKIDRMAADGDFKIDQITVTNSDEEEEPKNTKIVSMANNDQMEQAPQASPSTTSKRTRRNRSRKNKNEQTATVVAPAEQPIVDESNEQAVTAEESTEASVLSTVTKKQQPDDLPEEETSEEIHEVLSIAPRNNEKKNRFRDNDKKNNNTNKIGDVGDIGDTEDKKLDNHAPNSETSAKITQPSKADESKSLEKSISKLENEINTYREACIAHISQLAEVYKEHEMRRVVRFPEKKVISGQQQKSGWWQKFIKKPGKVELTKKMGKHEIRVRFAPSPTGLLHVGNIRIAILNYLFAKKNGGKFILRIDDTDLERSSKESEKSILEDLRWLGIQWDEFYRQSAHLEKYLSVADHLKSTGRLYPCYETKEELSLKRKLQISGGVPPVYDRASLNLSQEARDEMEANGIKPHWRFKLDENQVIEWDDLVHGKVSIPLNSISDPVLIKPDGSVVYTFASVVDDVNLGITHIIRGDDHITNTAAQIEIFRAISEHSPQFAHIPLLSSLDGQEVSKRTGSSLSIVNMRKGGIEPKAVWSTLSTLGTSNNVNHLDTFDELVEKFSFEKMSLASPKFSSDEVKALSRKIISEKSFEEVRSHLEKLDLGREFWETVKGNLDSINDVAFWKEHLFGEIKIIKEDEVFVKQMLETLKNPPDFDQWIKDLKQISGRKGKDLFHPIRVVLTGLDNGPELKKIVHLLKYDLLKSRLENNLRA